MLSRIMIIAGAAGAISLATPAIGQAQYGYRVSDRPNLFYLLLQSVLQALEFVLLAAAICFVVWVLKEHCFPSGSSESPCDCDECRANQHESEAELMREITKHQDPHTAMMRSEIELTRMAGVYGERPDIAAHEQRLRELRNQLAGRMTK